MDVEDFLVGSFPSHQRLRLFAENFVLTNVRYNNIKQEEKGGLQSKSIIIFIHLFTFYSLFIDYSLPLIFIIQIIRIFNKKKKGECRVGTYFFIIY